MIEDKFSIIKCLDKCQLKNVTITQHGHVYTTLEERPHNQSLPHLPEYLFVQIHANINNNTSKIVCNIISKEHLLITCKYIE